MKKRLLSFFAFALTALMVNAQSWTKPEIKLTTDQVPEKAYIYNVESSKFLTKGGAWGNHASVKSDPAVAFLYEMQLQEEGVYKLYCAAADKQHYLGRESAEDVYTDYNNQASWGILWEFKAVEGGYEIYSAHSCLNFGSDKYIQEDAPVNYGLYLLGYNPERDDLTNGNGDPMGTHDGIYMVDPTDAEGYGCTWAFMTEEDYATYSTLMSLYNKLFEALEVGYTEAELDAYAALLTSTDTEAIKAAVAEVDNKILNYAYEHATPENPFDVTAKIANPTFDGAKGSEPAGWTDEFGNMLIQNNKAYHIWDDEAGVESDEYGFNNFSQNWNGSGSITESNIYQIVNDLPQGTYILQADAIATAVNADTPVSGCQLYAESGAARYGIDIDKNGWTAPGSSLPHRYQLFVTHMGGDLKIGYDFTPGSVKWFGIDNVKLFYAGPVDNPGLVALTSAIAAAEPYIDYYAEEGKYYYSESTKDQLDEALSNAKTLTESEECLAAAGTINDLMKTVKAEVTAYGNLAKFAEQVKGDMTKYPFIDDMGDKYEEYLAAYDDKTATIDQINAWINGYTDYIHAGIKSAMSDASESNPIEVTGLFKNLGFEENEKESATPTNWESNSSAFKARANVGEVWNVSFDAHTTLTDLPAGAYRIDAHALSRSGSSVDNYAAAGAGVTAEMYANGAVAKVVSQHLGAGAKKLYANDVDLTGITTEEHDSLWAPNSMEGARAYFNVAETPYVASVTANLINDGDPLVVGFRDLGDADGTVAGNSWTIWSDVRVYYIGVSANALYDEMMSLAQTALGYADKSLVTAAVDKLSDAADAAEKLSSVSAEADIVAAIKALNDAIDYYNAGIDLVQKAMQIEESYSSVRDEYDADGTELVKILDEVADAVAEESFESNEKIQGWLDALPAARTAHIVSVVLDGKTPTEENPVDITAVMVNPKFDEGTNNKSGATGWTFDWNANHIGWDKEAQQTGSDYAYEFWKATVFDMNQTIVGLPEGFYRVSCQGLYRPGNNTPEAAAIYEADPDNARDVSLYANSKSVRLTSIYDYAQKEKLGVDGEVECTLNGEAVNIPNTMISAGGYFQMGFYTNTLIVKVAKDEPLKVGLKLDGNIVDNNWCVFDNFKVEALGNDPNTAVSNIMSQVGTSEIFNLNGMKQNRLQKGVNIVRKADGAVVKVLVK